MGRRGAGGMRLGCSVPNGGGARRVAVNQGSRRDDFGRDDSSARDDAAARNDGSGRHDYSARDECMARKMLLYDKRARRGKMMEHESRAAHDAEIPEGSAARNNACLQDGVAD